MCVFIGLSVYSVGAAPVDPVSPTLTDDSVQSDVRRSYSLAGNVPRSPMTPGMTTNSKAFEPREHPLAKVTQADIAQMDVASLVKVLNDTGHAMLVALTKEHGMQTVRCSAM